MNAAILLVTMVAGADTVPAVPATPAPVVTGSCNGGDCGGGCCDPCGSHRESLLSRIRAKLHRSSCDSCTPTCDSCSGGCGLGLKDKIRGLFHRRSDCGCDTGCTNGSCGTTVIHPAPQAEPIGKPKEGDPAKKMPEGGKDGGKVQLIPTPVRGGTLPIVPTTSGRSPF